MEWWRWAGLVTAWVCVILLLALRFDTLKDRPGWGSRRAAGRLAPWLLTLPVLAGAVLVGPWWLVATAAAVPAVTLLAMAAID